MNKKTLTVKEAIRKLRKDAKRFLPNLDSDCMQAMEHILELNETGILQKLEEKLTPRQEERLSRLIARLKMREPLEYITGNADFMGFRFRVTPDTLIPRVETETIVEVALSKIHEFTSTAKKEQKIRIADIGTGTGCIIISLANMLRVPAELWASDLSVEAIEVARENAKIHGKEKDIRFITGSLLEPYSQNKKFDILLANLPYVNKNRLSSLPSSVINFEPKIALNGGRNGTDLTSAFLSQATALIKDEATIIMEIAKRQVREISEYVERYFANVDIVVHQPPIGTDIRILEINVHS